jgi:hypothetical protein
MKPLYVLHKDRSGRVLGANAFGANDDYSLGSWVRGLDLRAGDVLAFGEAVTRPEFDEVEYEPAFLEPPAPTADKPLPDEFEIPAGSGGADLAI